MYILDIFNIDTIMCILDHLKDYDEINFMTIYNLVTNRNQNQNQNLVSDQI
ncbi:F-box protein [Megavirus baoshan]|uniref:F-box protein n=1 Tax=Megavirus baoshan TaxID=2496520 RepID=A0A8K1T0Y6_9VIRU|nr:F-box protein [Megavirus baoshan]UFX99812.1 F-box protein [Megavirus baoshan]